MFHALMLWLWNDQYVVTVSYMHKSYPIESSNEQNSNSFVEFLEVPILEEKRQYSRSFWCVIVIIRKNQKQCLRKIKEKRKKM